MLKGFCWEPRMREYFRGPIPAIKWNVDALVSLLNDGHACPTWEARDEG